MLHYATNMFLLASTLWMYVRSNDAQIRFPCRKLLLRVPVREAKFCRKWKHYKVFLTQGFKMSHFGELPNVVEPKIVKKCHICKCPFWHNCCLIIIKYLELISAISNISYVATIMTCWYSSLLQQHCSNNPKSSFRHKQ